MRSKSIIISLDSKFSINSILSIPLGATTWAKLFLNGPLLIFIMNSYYINNLIQLPQSLGSLLSKVLSTFYIQIQALRVIDKNDNLNMYL